MAERRKKHFWKKKNGAEIGNGLLPIEHEAGRWAGRGSRLGTRAAGRAGRAGRRRGAGMARRARQQVGPRADAQAAGARGARSPGGRRAGARGAQAAAREAGAGVGARGAGRERAGARLGERARGRASGRAARRAGARLGERQGERLGERACGWAHGARGARLASSTGAQPVRTGWANWVLVHPAWFSAWFFYSVIFLTH